MPKVSVRGGFSDRNGIQTENIEIQKNDFDLRTRIQLQNMISKFYVYVYGEDIYYKDECIQEFIKFVRGTIYSEYVDSRKKYDDDDLFEIINKTIINGTYDEILTLIESLIQYWDLYLEDRHFYWYEKNDSEPTLFEMTNMYFKREYIGYRFVDKKITAISDDNEIITVNETLSCRYQPVREHISKANTYLADRNRPDYENSIKESITAVEAICKIITKLRGGEATLDKMLKKLEDNGVIIHSSLKEAFKKLYGYTSDANGIRHAGDIGGPGSTFEEAKFMLVACCAFINYLIALNAD